MRRFITCALALTFVLYMGTAAYAQGKGNGAQISGAARQGHGPDTNHGKANANGHAKDTNQSGQTAKNTQTTKESRRDATIDERIDQKPELKAKLTAMLPAGMDLKTAATGFRNQGQFIAALNASKNLNIPFADLKARMMGTTTTVNTVGATTSTTSSPKSLGAAIHELKPSLSAEQVETEVQKAEKQAKEAQKSKAIS